MRDAGRLAGEGGHAAACRGAGVDRRTMLSLGGLTVSAAAAATIPLGAMAGGGVRYVVSDRRQAESLRFAEVLEHEGAVRLEATDGLTRLWQEVLRPHWRLGSGATAGLTSVAIWQLLAEQARGEGRRARLIGRHRIDPRGGAATHLFDVPPGLAHAAAPTREGGVAWPAITARLVGRCDAASRAGDATRRCGALAVADASHPSLVSWSIG